jgi:hypothetical protein
MMDKKLTVWIPHHVLKNAKKYSESQNISLNHLISIFLQSLPDERNFLENAPIVRRLMFPIKITENILKRSMTCKKKKPIDLQNVSKWNP